MSAPADPQTLGIVTDVGEVAQMIAALTNALAAINAALNSPSMIAARQRADIQALLSKMDADSLAAQKSGSLTAVDADSSG